MNSWTESGFVLRDRVGRRRSGGVRGGPLLTVWARRDSVVIVLGAALLVGLALVAPVSVPAAAGRAAVETAITLSAVSGVALLGLCMCRAGEARDGALLVALVVLGVGELVSSVAPSFVDSSAVDSASGVSLACGLLVAGLFAAVAFVPSGARRRARRGTVAGFGLVAVAIVAAAVAIVVGHPVALGLDVLAGAVLVVAGIGFVAGAGGGGRQGALLAGASLLLAGVRLQYLVSRLVVADAVTPANVLLLVACGLLVAVALGRYAAMRQEVVRAALGAERERIARDLHDGLAQDLAFIAAYGQRLSGELGPDHPVIVAAARALAASRGVLMDLSRSTALSTAGAAGARGERVRDARTTLDQAAIG